MKRWDSEGRCCTFGTGRTVWYPVWWIGGKCKRRFKESLPFWPSNFCAARVLITAVRRSSLSPRFWASFRSFSGSSWRNNVKHLQVPHPLNPQKIVSLIFVRMFLHLTILCKCRSGFSIWCYPFYFKGIPSWLTALLQKHNICRWHNGVRDHKQCFSELF